MAPRVSQHPITPLGGPHPMLTPLLPAAGATDSSSIALKSLFCANSAAEPAEVSTCPCLSLTTPSLPIPLHPSLALPLPT